MFFTQSRRLNEELKSLSVYSLRNSTKTTDSVPSASSPGRTPQYPISSIKEDQEKDVDNADSTDNIPVQSDSLESDKQSTTKTQPVAMRRTNSHPKLVSLYGSGKFKVGRNKQPVTLFFVLQNVFDAITFQNPISLPNFQESWKYWIIKWSHKNPQNVVKKVTE